MKLSMRKLFAAVGMLLASAGMGRAEEISLAPNFEPFAAPEITLVGHCTDGCADACADSCTDSCTSCCPSRHVGRDFWVCKDRCGGVVAGVDFLLLRPFASQGSLETGGGGATMNYNPSYRYWIGTQNADGLGARLRYWEFDRGATNGASSIGAEFRTLDVEMTQAVDFRRWNLLVAGGLRYAETGFDTTGNPLAFPAPIVAQNVGFDGVGLTFAAQATRDINKSGSLRMTSGARWSALYGNSKTLGAATVNRDDLVNVLEVNIGPQYRRQLRNGGYLTLGSGLEAQYWSNAIDGTAALTNGRGIDFGFAGFSSTIAITR